MSKKVYYKGLDKYLRGGSDKSFQYAVGGTFTADTDDTWHWLHFTTDIETAIHYGERIVEVEPVGRMNVYTKDDMNAKSIRVIRELPMQEILTLLVEKARSSNFLKKDLLFCLKCLAGDN